MLPARIADRIEVADCWEWRGHRQPDGYALIWSHRHARAAHRVVYEALVGPIPEGLTLDHLCRNRACVNPDHLEPVTMRINILRGHGLAAQLSRRDRCAEGHPFDATNTMYLRSGARRCRTCDRRDALARYHRRVARQKGI